jgi:hypothetical protein
MTLLIVALMFLAVTVATKAKVYYGHGAGYGGYYGGHYGKGYGYGHGYGGKIRLEILHNLQSFVD